MNKSKILELLIAQLHTDFNVLKQAALATYDDATNEETKPENKYDTRALEASYLAGAQALRVSETSELLGICQSLRIRDQDKVGVGALVEVEFANKTNYFFFLPKGGGVSVTLDNKQIQVMTPLSPLGKALIGLSAGDSVEVEMGSAKKIYEIINVI